MKLREKVRSCGIRKAMNVGPFTSLTNREISAMMVGLRDQNAPGKVGEASPAGYTHGRPAQLSPAKVGIVACTF